MTDLLRTKLVPPRLRAALVPRAALLERLDQGLERSLTLVSAPAGFGKTTLVRQWIANCKLQIADLTESSPNLQSTIYNLQSVAWISLDSGDDDPARFLRYVIAACQSFQADLGAAALALLETGQQIRFEAVLTSFINDLALLDRRCVLVLEDYHTITARQVHDLTTFLLDHLPAALHILLLTRSEPPLPLARLRARDDLYELRAADLRFSPAETQTFLQQSMPFALSAEALARLDARTEGWVAGLRLAALALQGRHTAQDVEQVLATFTGSHRHIVEYLVADVLDHLPAALQEFLLRTSVLSRLNGSLCDAATGRNDSASLLDKLEHDNLFLFQLGDQELRTEERGLATRASAHGLQPPLYRYHTLFAEAMQHEARRRLGDAALYETHERASGWYEQHGLPAEAIDAALAARSFARVAELVDQLVMLGRLPGELYTLRRWVEALPEALLRDRPAVCFAYATALLFTEDRSAPATMARIQAPLQLAEAHWRAEDNQRKLGEVLAFRGLVAWWQSDLAQAFAASRHALTLLPQDDIFWRSPALLNVGMEELLAGRLDAARPMILEARERFEEAENHYGARAAMMVLADLHIREGQLRQADQLYLQVIAQAGEDPVDRGHSLLGRAALAYQRNDLAAAEQGVAEAIEIGRQHADAIGRWHVEEALLIPGSLALARIARARGEAVRARQQVQDLLAQAAHQGWRRLESELLACQARLALADGDLALVQRWANDRAQSGDQTPLLEQERDALIVVRMLIAQGDAPASLRALERWHQTAQAQRRLGSQIEILALIALAQAATGDLPQAKQTLAQTLALAQAEGWRRLFLDEGERMVALLRATLPSLSDESLAAFARTLLNAGGKLNTEPEAFDSAERQTTLPDSQPPTLNAEWLEEPLSPQELRVLRLLAAGLSNPEIAEELVVSVNTIKTQVQSIYRKLNVSSRKEVRAAARRLNLH
jgi:LuxR family transcriptional regulator, maltose regulon positive regulatory protein